MYYKMSVVHSYNKYMTIILLLHFSQFHFLKSNIVGTESRKHVSSQNNCFITLKFKLHFANTQFLFNLCFSIRDYNLYSQQHFPFHLISSDLKFCKVELEKS